MIYHGHYIQFINDPPGHGFFLIYRSRDSRTIIGKSDTIRLAIEFVDTIELQRELDLFEGELDFRRPMDN